MFSLLLSLFSRQICNGLSFRFYMLLDLSHKSISPFGREVDFGRRKKRGAGGKRNKGLIQTVHTIKAIFTAHLKVKAFVPEDVVVALSLLGLFLLSLDWTETTTYDTGGRQSPAISQIHQSFKWTVGERGREREREKRERREE